MEKSFVNNSELRLKLLREALWNLEDKISALIDAVAEHDAELITLRRRFDSVLDSIETAGNGDSSPGGSKHR